MKLIFYSDLHFFAPHSIEIKLEFGSDIYYIGDIIDMANCKKDKVSEADSYRIFLKNNCKGNFLNGNHELSLDTDIFIKRKGICITHGDIFDWEKEKFDYWRTKKKPGKKAIKRFGVKILHFFRKIKSKGSISKKTMTKAAQYAKEQKCHTIVFGHKHPAKLVDQIHDGIRIVCVPRGKTTVEFEELI